MIFYVILLTHKSECTRIQFLNNRSRRTGICFQRNKISYFVQSCFFENQKKVYESFFGPHAQGRVLFVSQRKRFSKHSTSQGSAFQLKETKSCFQQKKDELSRTFEIFSMWIQIFSTDTDYLLQQNKGIKIKCEIGWKWGTCKIDLKVRKEGGKWQENKHF